MAFAEDKNNPNARAVILVEIDIPTAEYEWINYEAGIWQAYLTPGTITVTDDYSVTGYYENTNEIIYNVQSFRAKQVWFTRVTSIVNLRAQNESFYYDKTTKRLYVHFNNWHYPPFDDDIYFGAVEGYSYRVDNARPVGAYYDDVYYEPRIQSVPDISRSKDPLYYGLISFDGGNIIFSNADGYFDDFVTRELYGQPARILIGFEGYEHDDMRKVFTGYIQDFNYDYNKFQLSIKDTRRQLTNKLPVKKITTDEFLFLEEKNIDKYAPVAYGLVLNAPVLCINGLATGPYIFYFMDTEYHSAVSVDAVYADGEEITPTGIDLNEGTITLTSALCKDGDSFKEITADFHGASITLGIEVTKDLFANYQKLAYIEDNFNIDEIEDAAAGDRDVGLCIIERSDFANALEKISVAIDGAIYPQDDGRYTVRIFDPDRPVNRTILSDEWMDEPDIRYDSETYLTSAEIKFSENISKSEFQSYVNDVYEFEIYKKYKTYAEKSFLTILTTREDAEAKSENVMARSRDIFQQVQRKTKLQNVDLDIMDFVIAEHARPGVSDKPWKIYEITSVSKKLGAQEVQLSMVEIEDYTS